jgi:hypothetical protein
MLAIGNLVLPPAQNLNPILIWNSTLVYALCARIYSGAGVAWLKNAIILLSVQFY